MTGRAVAHGKEQGRSQESPEVVGPVPVEAVVEGSTRRDFLRRSATKAVYVSPVVAALSNSHAQASSSDGWDSTCLDDGSGPCIDDSECCAGMMCIGAEMFCMVPE